MANVEFRNDGSRHKTDQLVYNGGEFGKDDKLDKDDLFFIDRELEKAGCEYRVADLVDENGKPTSDYNAKLIHYALDEGNASDDIWGEGDSTGKSVKQLLENNLSKFKKLKYDKPEFTKDDKLSEEDIKFIDDELKKQGAKYSLTDVLDKDGKAHTEEDAKFVNDLIKEGRGKDGKWLEGEECKKNAKSLDENIQHSGDGEISGDTSQGAIGDCWLIAGMNGMNSSEEGRKKIKENVKWDDKGNATVLYNGTEYKVSKEDMDKNSEKGVKGDRDMLAIECAVREDRIKDGYGAKGKDDNGRPIQKDPLNGGFEDEFALRFGSKERLDKNDMVKDRNFMKDMNKDKLKKFFEEAQDDPNGFNVFLGGKPKAKNMEGDNGKITNGGGHGYSVTSVDMEKEEIEYINPWDSTKRFTISFDDLLEMPDVVIANANAGLSESEEQKETEAQQISPSKKDEKKSMKAMLTIMGGGK